VTGEIRAAPAKLVTAMRYRDVAAASEWLIATFGFDKQHVGTADDGTIAVAHLSVGETMIILLPAEGTELDRLMKQPDEIGGAETQNCYLVVEDADLHYAKAKAAGAEFVLDLKQYANGGRGFSCRDPEGHIWSFGTYDPWEGKSPVKDRRAAGMPLRGNRISALAIAAMAAIAVIMGVAGWTLATVQRASPTTDEVLLRHEPAPAQDRSRQEVGSMADGSAELARERREKEASRRAAQEARDALAREKGAREAAERTARQMETQLAAERRSKQAAEQALKAAQGAREAVERTARQLTTQLSEEQRAKETAERTLKETQGARQAADLASRTLETQLADERRAKEAAEQAAKAAQAARETAELATRQLGTQLTDEQRAKATAEQALKAAQAAREAAELATRQLGTQLTEEQRAKAAAEQALERALKAAQGARETADLTSRELGTQLANERRAKAAAEQALKAAHAARETAELATRQLGTRLTEEQRAREGAEQALKAAHGARETAELATRQLGTELTEERRAKEAAEQALKAARRAKEVAERTARQLESQLAEDRRPREPAERAAGEAQANLGQTQDADKGAAESSRQPPPISELFSLQDMKRITALADEKQLPLPPIRIRRPTADVPLSMRRFIGIWVTDPGAEQTSRQYMLIITNVLPTGHAVGFHIVGPPDRADALPSRPDFFAFVGRISESELLIKKTDPHITGELNARNELSVAETWRKGPSPARILLKPVWTLTDAERTAKP
jgi:uncharacterized glyoxalase superfamily protein PhnB